MKIEQGRVVKLRQQQYCPLLQYWGAFEITGLYPGHFSPPLSDLLRGKKTGDEFLCQMVLPESQYRESFVLKTKIDHLNITTPLKKGMIFTSRLNNSIIRGTIKQFDNTHVYIDCNYPYLGVARITLNTTISDVRKPCLEELDYLKRQESAAITMVL